MKILQSLLAVVQFVALGQVAFFGLLFKAITGNSDILPHIQDAHLHIQVATWHAHTIETAVHWGVGLGVASFLLATCAVLMVENLRRRSRVMENSPSANRKFEI
jgi:hypothetical protein